MNEEMIEEMINRKFVISNEYANGIVIVVKALIANLIAVNGLDRQAFVDMLTDVSDLLATDEQNRQGNQAKKVAIDDILRYMRKFEKNISDAKE